MFYLFLHTCNQPMWGSKTKLILLTSTVIQSGSIWREPSEYLEGVVTPNTSYGEVDVYLLCVATSCCRDTHLKIRNCVHFVVRCYSIE